MKINWINSWKQGSKKSKYNICIRLGTITLLHLYCNPGEEHRFILLNFGFEI
jgi:hypothetical protein